MGNPDLSVRKCFSCGLTKGNECFDKAKSGVNGRHAHCKVCRRVKLADDYRQNIFVFTCRLKKSFCNKNNIQFDLTPEFLESIYTDTCPVFGTKFEFGKKKSNSPTLDRIDPSKGYVQGNVCYISHRANRIKYDSTVKELEQILDWYKRATTISKESRAKWLEAVDPLKGGDDIV